MQRVVKSVSFNLDDPFEKEIFDIANRNGMFSKNVKRMMAACLIPSRLPLSADVGDEDEEELDFDSFAFDEEDE